MRHYWILAVCHLVVGAIALVTGDLEIGLSQLAGFVAVGAVASFDC